MNSPKLSPKREFQCERFYKMVVDQADDPTNYILFDLAQCFMDGFDIEKLRALLVSEDECLVSAGLFILTEVSGFPSELAPEVRNLLGHSDPSINRRAQTIANAYPEIIGSADSA